MSSCYLCACTLLRSARGSAVFISGEEVRITNLLFPMYRWRASVARGAKPFRFWQRGCRFSGVGLGAGSVEMKSGSVAPALQITGRLDLAYMDAMRGISVSRSPRTSVFLSSSPDVGADASPPRHERGRSRRNRGFHTESGEQDSGGYRPPRQARHSDTTECS